MKKLLLTLIFVAVAVQFAAGQINRELKAERKNILKEFTESASKTSADKTEQLLASDVGEPDSFGKNAKFLGTATSGIIYVYRACDPAVLLSELDLTLGADDRCLALPNLGQNQTATFNDIGRINIPKNSVDNVIYYIQSNFVSYDLINSFSNQVFSTLVYSPSLTIVSDALNDPAAINPNTGLPLNGSLTVSTGSKFLGKTYEANAQEFVSERFSTSATRGFARSYFADLGLPQNVINQLYKKPMTIKLNLRVTANFITFGQFGYSMRFLGN